LVRHPVSREIAATLGSFVRGGAGPYHRVLTEVFERAGYGSAAPYDHGNPYEQPSKEKRIRQTIMAAVRSPARSRDLVEGILSEYRAHGLFDEDGNDAKRNHRLAKAAFARVSWELTEGGEARPLSVSNVNTVAERPAIEDQLDRLRRAIDDPALMLGTAKEMLESTAKYVCEAFTVPYRENTSFSELWHLARDRLSLLPQHVDLSKAGGKELRVILQSSWSIAEMTNQLRNYEGTGHGRTLPTAISPEVALLVVREACSVTEFVLETLHRQMGRS